MAETDVTQTETAEVARDRQEHGRPRRTVPRPGLLDVDVANARVIDLTTRLTGSPRSCVAQTAELEKLQSPQQGAAPAESEPEAGDEGHSGVASLPVGVAPPPAWRMRARKSLSR